jgi:hypothetical protein
MPNKYELAPVLPLNTRHKNIWETGVQIHSFLTLALDGGEWSAACYIYFTLKERTTGTHWGGCVVPRASLNTGKEKERNILPLSAVELKFHGCQFVLQLLCSRAIPHFFVRIV